jgi:hypothetical protein
MAFTQLTPEAAPNIPAPNYNTLFQGVSQGEQYRAKGQAAKADLIKQGLEQFQENQQLLSKSVGVYAGALQSSDTFKTVIANEISNKSDLGKSAERMNKGNYSLTDALAVSNYANSYGVGEAQQNEILYRNQQIAESQQRQKVLNTQGITNGAAVNFVGQYYNQNGELDVSELMQGIAKVTPASIKATLNLPADTPDDEINMFLSEFRAEVGTLASKAQQYGFVVEPVYEPKIIDSGLPGVLLVTNKSGSKITVLKENYNPNGKTPTQVVLDQFDEIDNAVKNKILSAKDGDTMKQKLKNSFETAGMGLATTAGFAANMTTMLGIPPTLPDGNLNPEYAKSFVTFTTAGQATTEDLTNQLLQLGGYGDFGVLHNVPGEQRTMLINTLIEILQKNEDGELDIDAFLEASRPIPTPYNP